MEIFSLKIKRGKAGVTFPWDRVYLVKHEDRTHLKQLFRYGLIMPVDDRLRTMLKKVGVEEYVNHTHDRNDEELHPEESIETEWLQMLDEDHWVMAVPILSRWANKSVPRYLVAQGWYNKRKKDPNKKIREYKTNPEPLPNMAYFQTPEKNIRPVCVMCPRFILHQNGECKVGDAVCYEALPLGMKNYFAEGLDTPDAPTNVKEPEEAAIMKMGAGE